jgi:hypothetical protein
MKKTAVFLQNILAIVLITAFAAIGFSADQSTAKLKFNRDIRPLLSDRCFTCHGPDKNARKADLRLDRRDDAVKAGVLDLNKLDQSEILARINSTDPDEIMPPPKMKKPLSAAEKQKMRDWVIQGAEYEPHWAFVKLPEKVEVPAVHEDKSWVKNPLDAFILQRLQAENLKPAAPADRATWLRRVTFDLTGLPPSLADIDAFLADNRSEDIARNAVLDKLFASPAYGERMAMDWLDVARFADTFGYQADRDTHTWPWRDWLIRAFSTNLPYDKFLTWQVAGDLLPNPSNDQVLATAFNRLHRQTNEGGSIEEEFRVEYVSDRVRTLGTAFLGLSLECSRCHDHKYDPISQKDFYSLSAFFANIDEHGLYSHFTETAPTPALPLYKENQETRHKQLKAEIKAEETKLAKWLADFKSDGKIAEAGKPKPDHEFRFEDLKPAGDYKPDKGRSGTGQSIRFGGDDAFTCQKVGAFGRTTPFTIGLWVKPEKHVPRSIVLHASRAAEDSAYRGYSLVLDNGLPVVSLIHFWPGDAISIRGRRAIDLQQWSQLTITYDGSSHASGLHLYVNGVEEPVDVVRDHLTRDIRHRAEWGDSDGGNVWLTLGARFRDVGFQGGQIDDLEVYNRELSPLEVAHAVGVKVEASARDMARHALTQGSDSATKAITDNLKKLREEENNLIASVPQIMVMNEWPGPRRKTHVLHRGEYTSPREEVAPGVPSAIFPMDSSLPPNRLGLARWMTDPANPITARVIVNRLWMLAFGRGLVATIEDFGYQGQEPSHPALLDWLAKDLIASGWNLQHTLRLMLTSATYSQSSIPFDKTTYTTDPENRLLARGPRYRLSAEMIRDNALAVSGLLVAKVGGPSVKPYQPAGLWEDSGTGKSYRQDHGENLYRRSMYTFWRRTAPPASMTAFDAPSREFCMVKRERTATPLQALVTLNDPQFVEAARVLAEKLMKKHPGKPEDQLKEAYQLCTSHPADAREVMILKELLNSQQAHFKVSEKQARELLAVGETKRDEALPAADHAAMTNALLALFNFDPFVIKR